MPSRLGDPAPQAHSGAARFATPTLNDHDVKALKRQSVGLSKAKEKQPVTVRLTADSIDQLAEIERGLRRAGIKARRASTSEIVEALIRATTPEIVRDLIDANGA